MAGKVFAISIVCGGSSSTNNYIEGELFESLGRCMWRRNKGGKIYTLGLPSNSTHTEKTLVDLFQKSSYYKRESPSFLIFDMNNCKYQGLMQGEFWEHIKECKKYDENIELSKRTRKIKIIQENIKRKERIKQKEKDLAKKEKELLEKKKEKELRDKELELERLEKELNEPIVIDDSDTNDEVILEHEMSLKDKFLRMFNYG